jgi:hypothetical protein
VGTFWDDVGQVVGQAVSRILAEQLPRADRTRISEAITDLQEITTHLSLSNYRQRYLTGIEGNEMTTATPPPAGAVWILQSDLDADATAIAAAVVTLQALVSSGTLSEADESGVNTAIGNLTALAAVPVVTPPPDPSV